MQQKKKMCAGYDGNSHEDYIYKNINGKKYCKSCTLKLEPPKSLYSKKAMEKHKFKIVLKQTQYQKDCLFYKQIWENAFYTTLSDGELIMTQSPRCWNCTKRLGEEPNLMFFHHILEKRNFPELRYEPDNICILCPQCHNKYETYPDSIPKLKILRLDLYEQLIINKTN